MRYYWFHLSQNQTILLSDTVVVIEYYRNDKVPIRFHQR